MGFKNFIKLVDKNIEVIDPTREEMDLSDKRILSVDDNRINLKIVSNLLKDYKIVIDNVLSGQECLKKLDENNYDLILMDDMMPNMSGIECMKKIQEKNIKTPVIMLTANALDGSKENYLGLGFCEYMSKPLDKEKLKEMIKKYIITGPITKQSTEAISNEKTKEFLISKGIDVDTGISLLGNINVYNDTVKLFLDGINDRAHKLKTYLETNDMSNYVVEISALKVDCQNLGFTKLIELTNNHEIKSKENDAQYINEHYRELITELSRIIVILKKYI